MPTIVGVDETGRGSCFGPIITCAVSFPPEGLDLNLVAVLRDSKKLSASRRRIIAAELIISGALHAFGAASADRVCIENPLRATMAAMAAAVLRLNAPDPLVLVDGPYFPPLKLPGRAIIRGDSLIPEIMAASILAKVMRDALVSRLAVRYPGYGLDRHAGYGTAAHFAAITHLGPTRHHRATFLRNVLCSHVIIS